MSCSIPMANILMNKSSIELAVNNHGQMVHYVVLPYISNMYIVMVLRIKFQRKMCNGCHVSKSIKSEGPNVRKMRKISYSYSINNTHVFNQPSLICMTVCLEKLRRYETVVRSKFIVTCITSKFPIFCCCINDRPNAVRRRFT